MTKLQTFLMGRTSAKGNSFPEKEAGDCRSCFIHLTARKTALSSRKCSPCTPSPPLVAQKGYHTHKPFMKTLCGQKNVHVSLYKKVSLHLPWRKELAVPSCRTTLRLPCNMFIFKVLKLLYFLPSGVKAFSFCTLWSTTGCRLDFVCTLIAHLVLILFHTILLLTDLLVWDHYKTEIGHISSPPKETNPLSQLYNSEPSDWTYSLLCLSLL